MAFNWTCPYCNTKTTINDGNFSLTESKLYLDNADGTKILDVNWIVCPNTECQKLTLNTQLYEHNFTPNIWRKGKFIKEWQLLPDTNAKVYPDYIPKQLLQDYQEAYAILNLSPKASATLSRRCLQGIIRDFWGISKHRLIDEINAIKDKIDPLTWESIDAIRKVGNIGAHMEKDINLIIDVDPQEALLLIQLIELLFEEWYIHRHVRELKLKAIVDVSKRKEEEKRS
jgi:hypothetical protein